jgi:hypothetical protein
MIYIHITSLCMCYKEMYKLRIPSFTFEKYRVRISIVLFDGFHFFFPFSTQASAAPCSRSWLRLPRALLFILHYHITTSKPYSLSVETVSLHNIAKYSYPLQASHLFKISILRAEMELDSWQRATSLFVFTVFRLIHGATHLPTQWLLKALFIWIK